MPDPMTEQELREWAVGRMAHAVPDYRGEICVCEHCRVARAVLHIVDKEQERPIGLLPAVRDIQAERARQDAKWGVRDHHPILWCTILTEEVGELAKAILQWDSPDEKNRTQLLDVRKEAVQCAAVTQALIECIDRDQAAHAVLSLLDENARLRERCTWTEDADGNWTTTCDRAWCFTMGTPSDNGMVCCPMCGRLLQEQPYVEPPEEEEHHA